MIREIRIAWEVFKKEWRKTHPKIVGRCEWCSQPIFSNENGTKNELCIFCRYAYEKGIADCRDGNVNLG